MYNHQTIGDSISVQDPEVTLFENFVSEEEVGQGSDEKCRTASNHCATQQFVPAGNPTPIANTYTVFICLTFIFFTG